MTIKELYENLKAKLVAKGKEVETEEMQFMQELTNRVHELEQRIENLLHGSTEAAAPAAPAAPGEQQRPHPQP